MGTPVFVFPIGFLGHPTGISHLPDAWRRSTSTGFPYFQWAAGPSLF